MTGTYALIATGAVVPTIDVQNMVICSTSGKRIPTNIALNENHQTTWIAVGGLSDVLFCLPPVIRAAVTGAAIMIKKKVNEVQEKSLT